MNTANHEPIVSVKGLKKEFNGTTAVDGISFEIKKGEILALLGPNGAGKTTTLHMLLGLITPTAGEIRIFGKDMNKERSAILSRINFSSSYVSLPYSLTVIENLTVFARLYGVKNHREKIQRLLETFEISGIMHDSTRKLSSGQLTRVSLVKALINDPEILFLDEPTASLDPDIADRTRKLLKKIKDEQGLSILYTSHNMSEVEELCDRVVFLDKGSIIATGAPEEIKKNFNETSLENVFLKIARQG
ncbi:MAG: ABC transporter ATP-binding protein [Deltaproteobacteria bacterium]|nr:ABC transporter ATP-binding protein [Deltaproteobacteria bacterium]